MSRGTLDPALLTRLSLTGLSPSLAGFPKTILLDSSINYAVRTPACTHAGLGSFPFARRYLGNRVFFLLLGVLRCFSSPGCLPAPYLIQAWVAGHDPCWVPPFGDPRIKVCLPLPGAYRSLPRPSSTSCAKASAVRPRYLPARPCGTPYLDT